MKRSTIGLFAALAAAGLATGVGAQSAGLGLVAGVFEPEKAQDGEKRHDEKALKVIDKHVEAIGGRDLIMSIESMRTKGTIEIPMAGMTGQMEVFAAKPGKMAMVMELPGFGKTETGFDGEYGWSTDPMQGPRLMGDDEIGDMREQSDPNAAAKHRELYKVIEHAGEVDFKNQKAHKIRLVRDDRERFEYYSVESGLLIGQESVQASPMGDIKMVTQLSDYKEFDGMKVPTKMTQEMGPQRFVITISEVSINDVEDGVFERPAAVEALVEAKKEG